MRVPLHFLAGLIVCLCLFGSHAQADDAVYARVGERVITVDEVQEAARAAGASSRADVAEVAQELVDHELLLREARGRGFGETLAVRQRMQRLLVRALIHREVDLRVTRASISAEDVEARYRSEPERWRRPLEQAETGVRGLVWRERRDAALAQLVADADARFGHEAFLERLELLPPEIDERDGRTRLLDGLDCPHCRRVNSGEAVGPLPALPAPPDWATRGRPPR